MTAAATLTWVKIDNGHYVSACNRFSVTRALRRGEYTLFDRDAREPACPQYNRTARVYSIEHAKNTAARWVRGEARRDN